MRRVLSFIAGDRWLVATILIFLTASVVSGWRISQTVGGLFHTYRTGTWLVVEAQNEFENTRVSAAKFIIRPEEAELAALKLQFDVLWSRIPLILETTEGEGVRRVRSVLDNARHFQGILPKLESELALARTGDSRSALRFAQSLDAEAARFEEMTRMLLVQDELRYQTEDLVKSIWLPMAGFAVCVIAGLVLIAGNLHKNRHIKALFKQRQTIEEIRAVQLAAIETSGEGIATFDARGRLQYGNEAFHRLIDDDFTRILIGTEWTRFVTSGSRRKIISGLRAARRGSAWRGELTGRTLAGNERAWDVHIIAPDANRATVLIRDLTDAKEAEAQREALVEKLHSMDKMDAVGRLAGGVAHDFNNILAAIYGFGAMLKSDLSQQPIQLKMADQILRASERGKELVQSIMAFSRAEKAERHATEMTALCHEAAVMAALSIPRPAVFDVQIEEASITAVCNPTQINRVIVNLCINARDALAGGRGTVTLQAGRILIDGGRLSGMPRAAPGMPDSTPTLFESPDPHHTKMLVGVLADGPGQYLRIRVTDNGSGIPEPVMRRMFEPFYTTKAIGEGTGLGLASVLGIITAHRGAMMVESTVGVGTVFDVFLPIVAHPVPALSGEPAGHGFGLNVLVVGDDPASIDGLCSDISQVGCEPFKCDRPSDAFEALAAGDAGLIDAILIDFSNAASGLDFAAKLRASGVTQPLVVTEVRGTIAARRASLDVDFTLTRPVAVGELASALATLARKRACDANAAGAFERAQRREKETQEQDAL
jgi:signal transduction histidine kinase